jgi:hypothetical protein
MIAAVNNELTHAHTHTTAATARITLCVCEEMNVLGWEALSCSVPSAARLYMLYGPQVTHTLCIRTRIELKISPISLRLHTASDQDYSHHTLLKFATLKQPFFLIGGKSFEIIIQQHIIF